MTVGALMEFGDAQTGQLDRANGRTLDVISITDACSAANTDAEKKLKPRPWWKIW